MKNRIFLRAVAFVLLLVLLCLSVSCGDDPADLTPGEAEEKSFEELLFYLKNVSYFPLPEDFDTDGLSRTEIVDATGDRYAQYFTKEEYEDYTFDLGGNLVGIGVSITEYNKDGVYGIHVLSVFPDSPAEAAGMQANDVIVGIDGTAVSSLGYVSALSAVAGDAGTTVTLSCLREGVPYTTSVTRNTCVKKTVHSRIIPCGDYDIGYVYITEFDHVTTLQFVEAVEDMKTAGADRMVFDLRNNPGGYLHIVCEMLAYLLPDGDLCAVDYSYEKYTDYTIYAEGDRLFGAGNSTMANGQPVPISHDMTTMPIGVLIDNGTASAAELFTSALRDYAAWGKMNVTIFGTKSYGKGSMQSSFSLSNGDHVKMTIALYSPPSKVNYNGVGVFPTEGYAVSQAHKTVAPRFLGGYADIGDLDPTLTLALDTLAREI